LLGIPAGEVDAVASQLAETLNTRGIRLLALGTAFELVTAPETSDIIAAIRKEELNRELGKAGAETLSVILYRGPVARATIEYVRGVNCSFVIRNLLIRGLIERVPHPENPRAVLYTPTAELLKHLGIVSVRDLPDYDLVQQELDSFEAPPSNDGDIVPVPTPPQP
jgi:segregation and condensation protein B